MTPMKGLFNPQRSHDPEVKKCCCSPTEGEKKILLTAMWSDGRSWPSPELSVLTTLMLSTETLEKPQNLLAMLTKERPSRFQIKTLQMVSHQILIALKRNKEEQTLPFLSLSGDSGRTFETP